MKLSTTPCQFEQARECLAYPSIAQSWDYKNTTASKNNNAIAPAINTDEISVLTIRA
jgi:hypothetical protein